MLLAYRYVTMLSALSNLPPANLRRERKEHWNFMNLKIHLLFDRLNAVAFVMFAVAFVK